MNQSSPISHRYQQVSAWLERYRISVFGGLYALFALWGIYATQGITSIPAMDWMRIFSFREYQSWADIWQYLKELRTGIPPAISLLEILSWNWFASLDWLVKGFYRFSLIAMVMLPVLFTERKVRDLLLGLPLAWVMLRGILLAHPGNPQLYDVLLPIFLLAALLFLQLTLSKIDRTWLLVLFAVLAGFFLSMAELVRPFMLALVPLLVGIAIYWLVKKKRTFLLLPFLIPLLLFSGGWHLKLLIYNNGQVIWSNHGGTNLFRAWMPLVDQEAMNAKLQPEAPPLNDYGWNWDNLNTEVHAQNSKLRSQAVVAGIKAQPGKALGMLWDKTLYFTSGQTAMYDYDPQGPAINWYKRIVRLMYFLLAILLLRTVVLAIRRPTYLLSWEACLTFVAFFLSFMPIIGEAGEESRFLVSVVPFLMISGLLGIAFLEKQFLKISRLLKK